jgi:hypothetical protein
LTTIGSARDYVFATLVESFPFVQQVLDADRAAAEGREIYDAGYFSMFFGKVRPILERRLGDSIAGVASIITAAWIEAGRPALPVEQTRRPAKIRRR